jgi:hypothetical protein
MRTFCPRAREAPPRGARAHGACAELGARRQDPRVGPQRTRRVLGVSRVPRRAPSLSAGGGQCPFPNNCRPLGRRQPVDATMALPAARRRVARVRRGVSGIYTEARLQRTIGGERQIVRTPRKHWPLNEPRTSRASNVSKWVASYNQAQVWARKTPHDGEERAHEPG